MDWRIKKVNMFSHLRKIKNLFINVVEYLHGFHNSMVVLMFLFVLFEVPRVVDYL